MKGWIRTKCHAQSLTDPSVAVTKVIKDKIWIYGDLNMCYI